MAKRVLAAVLAGGGSQGAFEVGALEYALMEADRDYDMFFGTSVGSIIGAGLAMFDKGYGPESSAFVSRMWRQLTQKDVAKKRFLSPLSLAWSPSLQDTSPLRKLLDEKVDVLVRPFQCIAVDLVTGNPCIWTNEDTREDLIDGIMASSAAPLLYPPVHIKGQLLVDGGIVDVSMISQAIKAGATEIDLYLPESKEISEWSKDPDRVWNTAPRVLSIMIRHAINNDIKLVEMYNKMCRAGIGGSKREIKLNVLRPEMPLPLDSAEFDHGKIMKLIQIGYRVAKNYEGW